MLDNATFSLFQPRKIDSREKTKRHFFRRNVTGKGHDYFEPLCPTISQTACDPTTLLALFSDQSRTLDSSEIYSSHQGYDYTLSLPISGLDTHARGMPHSKVTQPRAKITTYDTKETMRRKTVQTQQKRGLSHKTILALGQTLRYKGYKPCTIQGCNLLQFVALNSL